MARSRMPTQGVEFEGPSHKHTVVGKHITNREQAIEQTIKDLGQKYEGKIEIRTVTGPEDGAKSKKGAAGIWIIEYTDKATAAPAAEPAAAEPVTKSNVVAINTHFANSSKVMVPISQIIISGENPRTSMDEGELRALIESIKETGQKEPVTLISMEVTWN